LRSSSTTSLANTSIWHNKATHEGGAAAGDGGGIFNLGILQAVNVTIGNNQADGGDGGGLLNRGQASISSGTFSANVATVRGGAVANLGGAVTMRSTILADSLGGADCHGEIESRGYNLLEDPSGCALHGDLAGTIVGSDPRHAELIEDGPHAGSYALLAGSPAIDAGPPDGCGATDQRGTPRPQDGNGDGVAVCDIGAYEHTGAPRAMSRAGAAPPTAGTPVLDGQP
jgi:hypothetical protein